MRFRYAPEGRRASIAHALLISNSTIADRDAVLATINVSLNSLSENSLSENSGKLLDKPS